MQMTTSFARTSFHSRENQEWLSHYGGCACKEPLFTRFFSLRVSFFSFSFVFQRASNSKSRPARVAQRRRKNLVACRVDLSTLFSWDENGWERMKASENSRVFDSWNEFLIFAIPFPLQRSGNVFRSFKDCAYEEEHRGRVETVPCQHRCRKTSSLPFDSYFEWHPLETLERVTSVTCGGITPAYFSCDYVSCESSKQSACKVSSRTMKSLM